MKYFLALFLLSNQVSAEVSRDVLIRGKVGSDFNERNVHVIDSFGQRFKLPRNVFPKGFVPVQGKSFAVEVDESLLDRIRIKD